MSVKSLDEIAQLRQAIDTNDLAGVKSLMTQNPELHRAPLGYGRNGPLNAAAATVSALEVGRAGQAYDVVDDQPATWEQLFTAMAAAVAAPPTRRLPRWMTRLAGPYAARVAVDTSMRVSNAKAKAELAWQPRFTTYREGIAAMVSDLCREDPKNLPRVPADKLRARM